MQSFRSTPEAQFLGQYHHASQVTQFDLVADTHDALDQTHWREGMDFAKMRISHESAEMTPPSSFPTHSPSFIARNRIVLWRVVFLTMAAICVLGTPAWSEHWLSALMRLTGIALVSIAALGRMWCALFISGRKSTELVTVGPYSMCRHPLYLFNLLGFVGVAMLAESLVAVAFLVLAFAALYPSVIQSEDRLLDSRFDAFREYRRRTPALFPNFGLYSAPKEWSVEVNAFVRNVGDSVCFPLLAIAVELVDLAHSSGWLKGQFPLY